MTQPCTISLKNIILFLYKLSAGFINEKFLEQAIDYLPVIFLKIYVMTKPLILEK